jgi:hypothetical protein
VLARVGLEQDTGAVEHPRGGFAGVDQLQQTIALGVRQLDHVLLVHGGSPRVGSPQHIANHR